MSIGECLKEFKELQHKHDVELYRKVFIDHKRSRKHISILLDKIINMKNEEVEFAKEFQRGR